MNQSSPIITGGITITAVTIVPYVTWALDGFPNPYPDGTPYLLAAGIVTLGHWIVNLVNAKFNKSTDTAIPVSTTAP